MKFMFRFLLYKQEAQFDWYIAKRVARMSLTGRSQNGLQFLFQIYIYDLF
jgi:hypothetical protein